MNLINESDYVICICEGKSEAIIIEELLRNSLLVFDEAQLVGDKVHFNVKYRKAKNIQRDFLNVSYDRDLHIIYIGDKVISLKFDFPYQEKIKNIYYATTRPELEALMIHALGEFKSFNKVKSKIKPCEFVANLLKEKTTVIKSKDFILKFYQEYDLVEAIQVYKRKANHNRNEGFLADLLKNN